MEKNKSHTLKNSQLNVDENKQLTHNRLLRSSLNVKVILGKTNTINVPSII